MRENASHVLLFAIDREQPFAIARAFFEASEHDEGVGAIA